METRDYNKIISEIRTMPLPDQLRLMEDVAVLIRKKTEAGKLRSIMELKGKGKHLWKVIDVKAYIGRERSSWDLGV